MDRLFPLPGQADVAVESVLADYADPPLAGGRWWLRANMLSSVDGSVTGPDGRSGSLATSSDRVVFRHLRSLADAIIVGAGTVRAEDYRQPDGARLVVVSRSLSIDPTARHHALLAMVCLRMGDLPAAASAAEQASRLEPENKDYRRLLAGTRVKD